MMNQKSDGYLRLVSCLVFVFCLGLTACSGSRDKEMVYHESIPEDARTLDPAVAYDPFSLPVVHSIYEPLYQYAYLEEEYRIIPLLAADLPKFSADQMTVTIPIRPGVLFQNGRELKAQDFVYAFKRLASPSLKSPGWWIFDNKLTGISEFHEKLLKIDPKASKAEIEKLFDQKVEGVQALNDHTLQLKLVRPYPQLLFVLSMAFSAPVPREDADRLADHPVGTGPYMLKKWDRHRQIVLRKNPNFHPEFYPVDGAASFRKQGLLADFGKKLPFLDQIVFTVVRDSNAGWIRFLRGEEDSAALPYEAFNDAVIKKTQLAPGLAAKGVRLHIENGTSFFFLTFNLKDKWLGSNKLLRQALSAAINREEWIERFTHSLGKKQLSVIPPGLTDQPKTTRIKYDYNPKLAKALLQKLGYPRGVGLPEFTLEMRGEDPLNRELGEFFKQQFEVIGVKVNVTYNTFPAFMEKAKQGNFQMAYGGWSLDYPDAENVLQLLYGPNKTPGPNEASFDHADFNQLYQRMSVLMPGPIRAGIIQKMNEIVQEECPWALGYSVSEYSLSHPWLLNYRPSSVILNRYKYLRIDQSLRKQALKSPKQR